MEMLGTLGVLIGVILIIYLAVRELSIVVAAPIATIVIILFNQMDIMGTILGPGGDTFMGALANYIMNYFLIFMLGSMLAKLMEESGATVSIANYILEKIGYDNPYRVMVAIFIISAVLTYGGISLFVVMFAVIPLARSLFKKLDISWNLIQGPVWLGIATITMTMIPGTPAIQNVIPMAYLGTTLTAAAIPSILASVACVIWGLGYMKFCLNRSQAKGETFSTYTAEVALEVEDRELPSFGSSVTPLVSLITIVLLGSTFGNDFLKANVIYVASLTAIILSLILFRNYLPSAVKTISTGGAGAIGPIFTTAASVAFGAVVMIAPGFNAIQDFLLNLPGGANVSLTVLTAIMSGVTGSTSGALGIVMPAYAEYFLATGLHPEMIHRIASVAANILTIVPQGGAVLIFLGLTGLNHKNGYLQGLIITFVGAIIAILVIIVSGQFIYY